MSVLKNLMNVAKQRESLIKRIDTLLLQKDAHVSDGDRKSICNSPSSSLGCSRANFYQREGIQRDVIEPRVRRIFDNGHGMHERIQNYLKKDGVLLMDEVPLFNGEYEIQGHTDGILKMEDEKHCEVLELKSINSRQFQNLKEPLQDHRAQAQVYIFCLEEHRKDLQKRFPTKATFTLSEKMRRKEYEKLYQHLKDGTNYTREQKIEEKVRQHILADKILYSVTNEITQAIVLYENKDTQDLKEYTIGVDKELMQEILDKFQLNNSYWADGELPPRECRNKTDGKWCSFVTHCFV